MKQHHNNNSTDGNVSIELQMWEKSGNAEPKKYCKGSVSKPIDGGEGKGDVEVSDLDQRKTKKKKEYCNGIVILSRTRNLGNINIRKGERYKSRKVNTVPAKKD
jgi:hypothetical protein